MNKQRRKRLTEAMELLQEAQQIIEEVKDEEQEAFDNLPEGLQCSERGEALPSMPQIKTVIATVDTIRRSFRSLTRSILIVCLMEQKRTE